MIIVESTKSVTRCPPGVSEVLFSLHPLTDAEYMMNELASISSLDSRKIQTSGDGCDKIANLSEH
jgi:hypothetical protein